MNIEKLFEAQRILDGKIYEEHPLQEGEDRIEKKILSLLVEIGELANETKCFKYWSNKPPAPKEITLEEFVDGVHFFISLAIDFEIKPYDFVVKDDYTSETLTSSFNELYLWVAELSEKLKHTIAINLKFDLHACFSLFIGIGEKFLGFSWDEIAKAYIDKNKVNHQRQDSGY